VSGSGQASQSSQSVPRFLQQLSASLPVLRRGARGDLVGVLQFELGGLEPDEYFGPKTEARLIEFQKRAGIAAEVAPSGKSYPLGVCGVRTWAALFTVPAEDDEDDEGGPMAMRTPWRSADDQVALERAWSEGAQDDDEPTVA
jgi:peptidoglycan hydrolase-like protein with peptidoglycan-binding domain